MPVHFLSSKHAWETFQRPVTTLPNRHCWPFNYHKQLVRTPTAQETHKHKHWGQSKGQKDLKHMPRAVNTNWTLMSTHLFTPCTSLGNMGKTQLPLGHYQWGLLQWVSIDCELSQDNTTSQNHLGHLPLGPHPHQFYRRHHHEPNRNPIPSIQLLHEKMYFAK